MLVRLLLRFALYNLLTLASCIHSEGKATTTSPSDGLINSYDDNLTLPMGDKQRRVMDTGESQKREERGKELLSAPDSQTDLYTDNVLPTPRIRAVYTTTPVSTIVRPSTLGRAASTKEYTAYNGDSTSNSYKQEMINVSNLWNSSFYGNVHNSSNITGNRLDLFNTTSTSTGTHVLGTQPQLNDVSSTTKTKQTEYKYEVTDNNTDPENAKEKDAEAKSTNSWLSRTQHGKNVTQETGTSATTSPHTVSPPEDPTFNILDALLRDRSKENETEDLYGGSRYENFTAETLQENTSAPQDLQTVIFSKMVTVTSTPRTIRNSTTQVPPTRTPPKKILPEIRIAWLAPLGWNEGFSAETTVNVLKQAIVDCRRYLPHTAIRVKWYDTKCTAKDALSAAVDARREFDPDLILGPPCNPGMTGVAMLASHWNLPIFGWVSNDHSLEDRSVYTTLVRLLGPLNQFSSTMNFVTILFRWRRFAMIYDEDPAYKSVNEAITLYLTKRNSTVTSQHTVYHNMPESQIQIIFQQVRKYARVIVFSVPWMTMRRYMLVAHRLGMTGGDFSFICINGDVYTNTTLYSIVRSDAGWKRNDSDDEEAREAFESVIHVIMATYNLTVYATFADYVSKAETLKSDLWQLPDGNETIDAYAPFVYDATVLWAKLVNMTLSEGGSPRNGSNIFRLAKGLQTFGVTGKLVLDDNCDRLSNIWFLDMQPDGTFKEFVEIYNTLNGGVLKTIENARVNWRDGSSGNKNAPPDSPSCGFEDELCKKVTHQVVPDYTDSIVGAAVGSSFVFIIAVSVQVTLRCYRRRQQLESMLWQVKFEEIDFLTAILSGSVRASFRNLARNRNSNNKKLPKPEASLNLDESSPRIHHLFDTDAVMFGSVAYVRGSLVSVKRMTRANVSLTKELLQQLNKLMELKHQNITGFVGACVDPGRILLLWEYCAKGSLQDIILNQNIKLDQLFKFALCQDVAKGLEYIHKSSVCYHGNLKSSNCVVDSRWTCKLTDFGVPRLRMAEKASIPSEDSSDAFWTAPEILRTGEEVDVQKADIFALGVVFKEVFTRSAPYSEYGFMNSIDILHRVMRLKSTSLPFRPLINGELKNNHDLCQLINDCWAEDPSVRPSATRVLKVLGKLNPSKNCPSSPALV